MQQLSLVIRWSPKNFCTEMRLGGRPHIFKKPICNAVPRRISRPYRVSTERASPLFKVKNSLIASALKVGGSCVRPRN
jgi:hypothetical protein